MISKSLMQSPRFCTKMLLRGARRKPFLPTRILYHAVFCLSKGTAFSINGFSEVILRAIIENNKSV